MCEDANKDNKNVNMKMVRRVTDEAASGRPREDSQYRNPIQLIQLQPNLLEVTELISPLQSLDGRTAASLYLDD